ncbi:MAG: methyltransferase domain-containing protein [Gammaproteobacteria bacterium]
MRKDQCNSLACPNCRGKLQLKSFDEDCDFILNGFFLCDACQCYFPLCDSIPILMKGQSGIKIPANKEELKQNVNKQVHQQLYWEGKRKRRDANHVAVRAFVEPKVDFVVSSINDFFKSYEHGVSLLDVGCGNGYFSYWFSKSGFDVAAMDFSLNMLRQAKIDVKICGDANFLPFPDKSFDVVFCSNLLHHILDPLKVVKEMARVSRKIVVLSEPNKFNPLMFLFGLVKRSERGLLRFSRKYFARLASEANLRVIDYKGEGVILPNITPGALVSIIKKINCFIWPKFFNMVILKKNEK